jgi:hypothetical protein
MLTGQWNNCFFGANNIRPHTKIGLVGDTNLALLEGDVPIKINGENLWF